MIQVIGIVLISDLRSLDEMTIRSTRYLLETQCMEEKIFETLNSPVLVRDLFVNPIGLVRAILGKIGDLGHIPHYFVDSVWNRACNYCSFGF